MPEMLDPTSDPAETGGYQPLPTQGGRPGPDADPQPTPAQPAPQTARPDMPSEGDPDVRETPLREPGPGEAGGETPNEDPLSVTDV